MWIMISGPYRSGSNDPETWRQNLKRMNEEAYQVFLKGHMPVIGVNMALPIIEIAGQERYDELMMPMSMPLAQHCNAVYRISGPSEGADMEVQHFKDAHKPIYYSLDEIPTVQSNENS